MRTPTINMAVMMMMTVNRISWSLISWLLAINNLKNKILSSGYWLWCCYCLWLVGAFLEKEMVINNWKLGLDR